MFAVHSQSANDRAHGVAPAGHHKSELAKSMARKVMFENKHRFVSELVTWMHDELILQSLQHL